AGTLHAELAGGGPSAGRGARPPAARGVGRTDGSRRLWLPPPSSILAGLPAPYDAGHVAPAAGACPRTGARRRAAHHRGQVLLRRRPQALPARGLLRAVRGHRPWLSLSRRADPGDR